MDSFEDEIGQMEESFSSNINHLLSTSNIKSIEDCVDDNLKLQWATIESLPSMRRMRSSLFGYNNEEKNNERRVVDVSKLNYKERQMFIDSLIRNIEHGNRQLLENLKERIKRVDVKLPTMEVRYKGLTVEAQCKVRSGTKMPNLWNSINGFLKSKEVDINILKDVSGIIKPSRMTLLLGPPGCGKTTLLLALAGQASKLLKVNGEITCNGWKKEEFDLTKAAAYITQNDQHVPEMTVRETLDFSARCQGVGCRADIMLEVGRREKQAKIIPNPDIDTYMKILGLETCSETIIGDAVRRGISGGQKRRCPQRKGIADFLQEVISKKDQAQYWYIQDKSYNYITTDKFVKAFQDSTIGKKLEEELSKPYDKEKSNENAFVFSSHSITKWEMLRTCMDRELLLLKRNSFVYLFKTIQIAIVAIITMTAFLRTKKEVDLQQSTYYAGSLKYAIIRLMTNGIAELTLSLSRLAVFYKQRDLHFYPTWAYSVPAALLKLPISLVESFLWTAITYYGIGYSHETERQVLVGFLHHEKLIWHQHLFSDYLPLSQENHIQLHFQEVCLCWDPSCLVDSYFHSPTSENMTLGQQILKKEGVDFKSYFYWLSAGALFGLTVLFNIGITLALAYMNDPGASKATISNKKFKALRQLDKPNIDEQLESNSAEEPNTYTSFTKGILTALMGISGAGKTTLMDVLCGRKTQGTIEGEIRIGGYPKVQETFTRISGYCEQNDIHSPHITIEESIMYSAWLRLPQRISPQTKEEFVRIVLKTIELDTIKDSLVGMPGINGISKEQRKRLTIAVELVANPSIIFLDEPTTGLDARAAAIVMRAVRSIVETGRTIVCTIHQPSIDIFESFDEQVLLLDKEGALISLTMLKWRYKSLSNGINNCSTVLPMIARERLVFYRERSAGMYPSYVYALAQVIIEMPYIFILAVTYTIITFPTIDLPGVYRKFGMASLIFLLSKLKNY
ncbi:hypothetical protein HPP92_025773 [Vanilla planifolia]|uniref:ABC transporter domain-containing protein n=1 Tax=Vanilla planifolia TaxID=51239 RepID=A0A835PEH9_VANPL|nr:hypothetical protein HPP92_025773 [Vanilla planifolia]